MDLAAVTALAKSIAEKCDSDVFLYNAPVKMEFAEIVIEQCAAKQKKSNVILVLITEGGSADAAYRIARCLQREYSKFTVFVPGWCKSAGTLITIGAHEVIMTDYAELGPLDIQLSKTDELWEYNSGLTVNAALDFLQDTAFSMFEQYMVSIKAKSGNRISFRTATDISLRFVVELLRPIYDKIEPEKIGDISRSMTIAYAYGQRLNLVSDNLISEESLQLLVQSYPSHGFVIDKDEARELFSNVDDPDEELERLADVLSHIGRYPMPENSPVIQFLNVEDDVSATDDSNAAEEEYAPEDAHAVSPPEENQPASGEPNRGEAPAVNQRNSRRAARASSPDGTPQVPVP